MNALQKARDIATKFRASLAQRPTAAKKDEVGSLYIYAAIGASFWSDGIGAQDVCNQLKELEGCKTLNVYINSEGGDVFDGVAIHTQLERFDAEVVCCVDGLAASAASFIAMAGDRIVMAPSATMMIHEASSMAYGGATDLRAMADVLDTINGTISGIYAKRTGKTDAEVRALLAAETWMDAAKAKSLGFCDEISGEEAAAEEPQKAAASNVITIAAATQSRIAAANKDRLIALAAKSEQHNNRASPAAPARALSARK